MGYERLTYCVKQERTTIFSKAGLGQDGEDGDGRVAKRKGWKEMQLNVGNQSSFVTGELGREVRPVPLYRSGSRVRSCNNTSTNLWVSNS